MSKLKTLYVCQNCGQSFPRWSGQCASCSEWNTLVEEVGDVAGLGSGKKHGGLGPKGVSDALIAQTIVPFSKLDRSERSNQRLSTGIGEFDRVLGGEPGNQGMVPGALMLIGGEPGIGKSTLLTQMVVALLGGGRVERPIFYVCGEESPSQIALRVERVGALVGTPKKTINFDLLRFVTSTDVDVLVGLIEHERPSAVVVDSVQTMTTEQLTGAAGSVGQVRETADRLRIAAKKLQVPIFLVGHVTKEGQISGPKILEHIVDSVLELSGERTGELRLLRTVKNRFGATDEVGVFRVTSFGYESVANPTDLFLEHAQKPVSGSATVCVMEGTRPLLLEVQALVVDSQLAMPRRVGRGLELSRIQVLSAVLQKHCRLPLATHDIFVSAAGGFTIKEPAVDLGLAVAIASSLKSKALPPGAVFIGEVGLLGEVRSVNMIDRRVKEAKRLGFEHIISRKTDDSVRAVLKKFDLL